MVNNQRRAGIVLSYISMFLSIAIGLIYVPMLLHFLGKEQYGLYQLMGSLIAYMAVMDFGLANTITRYYSRYLALKDEENQSNVLAISSIIYGVITVIVLIAGVIIYFKLGDIFKNSLTVEELAKAKQIYIIQMVNIVITIPSNIFTAVINSHERFIFIRGLSILQTVLQPFVVIAVMYYKADVIGLVIVISVFNIGTILVKIYYAMFKIRAKIKLYCWNKVLVKEMTVFSFFIFLNMVIDQIYFKTDQIILGIVAGTSVVAVYSIASQLDQYYINFSSSVNSVFLPRIAAITAITDDMTEINGMFNKVGRIQYAIMAMLLSGFIMYGKSFIVFWAGPDFSNAYYMSLIVMIPLLVPLIQSMGIVIIQAKNKHAFRSKMYFGIALLNIALSIPLAKRYGGIGCAIGTAIGLIIGNWFVINIYYHKVIGIDIIDFGKEILSMTPPVAIVMGIGIMINHFIPTSNLVILGIKMIAYVGAYSTLMWFMGLNTYEKDIFAGMFNKINKRRKRI
ncbi:oligosaccharide flippase family protein [Clostridium bowmanii]|uniref:lipopolysaccharide biosynthesis protein n=1 Tax=Clostridium bowmanii TaxID=132925 RepID=UPI001C0B89EB|nr:oligosaccharide flippase family protein [Clostridium bowmanii]MBU3188425.1 oligosaccharide flippase family protein [Clostridium bowmanii]MCA1072814.1 oligosaccharide flippase family protein [Clostridium bowmanii]